MGEEFLSKQTEQFIHGQDKAKRELSQRDLLTSRPEFVGVAFSCKAVVPEYLPSPGTVLLLAETEASLMLMAADGPVGIVNEAKDGRLRDLMRSAPTYQKMLKVSVHETVDFLGEFTIRISTEGPAK